MVINLIKNKLVKSSGMVLIAMILSSLFMYLFRIIIARNLTIAEYGLFFSINSMLILIGTFANFGLAEAYIKFFCQYKAEKNYSKLKGLIYMIAASRAVLAFLLLILCYFLSDFLITYYFKSGNGKYLFLLLVFANMLTSATFNFMHVTYRSLNKMKEWGIIRIAQSGLLVLFTFIGFLFYNDPIVGAIALTIAPLVVFIIFYHLLKKEFKENIKADINFQEWKRLMFFGVSIVLIAVCNFILNSTDTAMLTYFSTLQSVGLYQIALPIARLFLIFTTAINIPLLPYFSELYAKKNMDEFKNIFYKIHKLSLYLLLPVTIIGALLSKYAIWIFFGKEFISAAPALSILFFSMFFMLIFNINLNVFISRGKPKIGNILIAIGAGLNIILNYFFILKWDFIGAALATMISYAFLALSGFYISCRTVSGNHT